jgi:membrane-bound serine protease (ClpP class)
MRILCVVLAGGAIILAVMGWLSWRAGSSTPPAAGMVGLKGKAMTAVSNEGRVMVMGEYWRARSRAKIDEGAEIRVVAVDGLTLEVEAFIDGAIAPRPVSAIITPDEGDS